MATASPSGEVAVWDLNRHRLSSVIRAAHDGAVTGLAYLPSQPLLLTSGPDNALKVEQSTAKCIGVASTIIPKCVSVLNSVILKCISVTNAVLPKCVSVTNAVLPKCVSVTNTVIQSFSKISAPYCNHLSCPDLVKSIMYILITALLSCKLQFLPAVGCCYLGCRYVRIIHRTTKPVCIQGNDCPGFGNSGRLWFSPSF